MLQPADVLLLDEPTNDLDIPTLEILEESLLEYTGALVLVTHDRYMLDRVSTVVLGLDGTGGAERFADYSQWEEWSRERKTVSRKQESSATKSASSDGFGAGAATAVGTARLASAKKKLSYNENRELETIEQRVAEAEADLQSKHDALLDPAIMSDGVKLHSVSLELEAAQQRIDELYSRWVELEDKLR
jgi:ATP-binding cassette subfamily F protein uup